MGTYRNQIRIWKACSSVSWMGRRCWIHECLCHLFRMIYTRCQWYWKFMDSMTLLNFNGAYFYIYISGMNLCINILAFRFQNKWLRSVSVRGFFFRIHSTFRNIFICPIKTNVCPIAYLQSPFTIYTSVYIGIYSACDCGIFHS